jgi:hypothetical protein
MKLRPPNINKKSPKRGEIRMSANTCEIPLLDRIYRNPEEAKKLTSTEKTLALAQWIFVGPPIVSACLELDWCSIEKDTTK